MGSKTKESIIGVAAGISSLTMPSGLPQSHDALAETHGQHQEARRDDAVKANEIENNQRPSGQS
ncbi:hypothetical protein [Aureimonas phyllosphaerae]|uniref:Uncharacterized protein n=1 Tax=Aureimonas phyllosphaerae TaxID=1166078 RepID=A0A7W6C246_9HYPH|nr:hypothetical protein [Aureimonas phyllosphaerae]MBB3938111.1 hypothetical protein [Aureimonas phyllosphaerae]MBB3962118.1 hypothetical protein [Aureimonas phyllosphaerae]